MSLSDPIKVDIWSDVQCPWCYIGKRKFEAGIVQYGRPVEIEYHSYELAPDTPVDFDGSPVDYLSARKGIPVDQVHDMLARVSGIAAEVGLDYHFDEVHQTNTRKAHELLHFAKAHGKQSEVKELLLKAYFVDGGHVGNLETLASIAAEAGLWQFHFTRTVMAMALLGVAAVVLRLRLRPVRLRAVVALDFFAASAFSPRSRSRSSPPASSGPRERGSSLTRSSR